MRRPMALLVLTIATLPACATIRGWMPGQPSESGAAARPSTRSSPGPALPSIEDRTDGFLKMDGFLPIFWDEDEGRL